MKDYYDPYHLQNYDPYRGIDDDERLKTCLRHLAAIGMGLLLAFVACALLGSCKPQEHVVTIVTHSTDTLRLTQVQRDSIYVHDSIHVSEKGDTVTIERWHTAWRDRWHSDTVYQARHDSIPAPYPVEVVKEVTKPLTWWQRTRMYVGGFVIFGLIIFAAWKIYVKVK